MISCFGNSCSTRTLGRVYIRCSVGKYLGSSDLPLFYTGTPTSRYFGWMFPLPPLPTIYCKGSTFMSQVFQFQLSGWTYRLSCTGGLAFEYEPMLILGLFGV